MKKIKLIVLPLLGLLLTSCGDNAQSASTNTETFKVYGNCGMCEKTIEGALKNVEGIEKNDWNKDTKMMEVTFDSKTITLKDIKQKIADVGYDTEEIRSTDQVYNNLHECCQYKRPE